MFIFRKSRYQPVDDGQSSVCNNIGHGLLDLRPERGTQAHGAPETAQSQVPNDGLQCLPSCLEFLVFSQCK